MFCLTIGICLCEVLISMLDVLVELCSIVVLSLLGVWPFPDWLLHFGSRTEVICLQVLRPS